MAREIAFSKDISTNGKDNGMGFGSRMFEAEALVRDFVVSVF